MRATNYMALGLDFGGVIVEPTGDDVPRVAQSDPRRVAPVPGVETAVRELVQLFEGRVWLVSKGAKSTCDWARRWLDSHRFHESTCLRRDHVEFVADRAGKRARCLIHGITHFVDDRAENLTLLRGAVDWLLLFGVETVADHDSGVCPAPNWAAARQLICDAVASAVAQATPHEIQAKLSPHDRQWLESSILGALAREGDPDMSWRDSMDRVDCLIDLNHRFGGVPAATRALLEVGCWSDDLPDVGWWAGYYLGDLWAGGVVIPQDRLSRLSTQAREGFAAGVEDESPDRIREVRILRSGKGAT